MKKNKWILLLALMSLSFAACAKNKNTQKTVDAPDFALELTDGSAVSLKNFKGKALVLHFWATWCPPCRMELPMLQEFYERIKGEENIDMLCVCTSDKESSYRNFLADYGYTFKSALDAAGEVAYKYNALGLPTSVLINPDGKLENVHVGAMNKAAFWNFVSPYYKP